MGYFTTITNNYQQLINFFPDLKMILAMKNNQPQADLGNSPSCLGNRKKFAGHRPPFNWLPSTDHYFKKSFSSPRPLSLARR